MSCMEDLEQMMVKLLPEWYRNIELYLWKQKLAIIVILPNLEYNCFLSYKRLEICDGGFTFVNPVEQEQMLFTLVMLEGQGKQE